MKVVYGLINCVIIIDNKIIIILSYKQSFNVYVQEIMNSNHPFSPSTFINPLIIMNI